MNITRSGFSYNYIDSSEKVPQGKTDLDPVGMLARKLYDELDDEWNSKISGEELLKLLKEISGFEELYEMLSGVGETYTVEQQTLMTLHIFKQEFSTLSKEYKGFDSFRRGGCRYGSDSGFFLLFLALKNIGKGLNFLQGRGSSKDEELRTTRDLIQRKSEWIGLSSGQLKEMMALLQSDVVGDFLKTSFCEESLQTAVKTICAITKELGWKPTDLLNRLVLIHQITASSYPIVREHCFKTEDGQFIDANGIELPKLKRDKQAKSAEEFFDSVYSDDYQKKLRELRRVLSFDAKKMIIGGQRFNSKELIGVLSRSKELRCAYGKFAGVGEGYTVKQHTHMVLDVFTKDLLPRPRTHEVLERTGLTPEAFSFFLALHDIGKGEAVERATSMADRKDLELTITRRMIHQHADELGLKPYLPIFDALLSADLVGDFLKSSGSAADCEKLTKKLLEVAYDANISVIPFLELFLLFHQCDASSYPFVRNGFFTMKQSKTILIGGIPVCVLDGEGDAIYSEANRNKMRFLRDHVKEESEYKAETWMDKVSHFDLENPQNISLDDLEKLIAIRRSWRFHMALTGVDKKQHAPYQTFRATFKDILNHKLPTRLTQALKLTRKFNPFSSYWKFDNALSAHLPRKKEMTNKSYHRYLVSTLMKQARPYEKRLRLLERMTVLHGSDSNALFMMILSGHPELKSTGALIHQEGIAPMSGETQEGIRLSGVNEKNVSAETVANFTRTIRYTGSNYHYDHNKNIGRFSSDEDPLLWESRWDQTTVYLLQMRQWDEEAFQRIINTDQYLKSLEEYRARALKPIETLLQITHHNFTKEERNFISDIKRKNGKATVVPKGLSFLFSSSVKDARTILNHKFTPYDSICKHFLDYCRWGGSSYISLFGRIINLKLNSPKDVKKVEKIFSEEIEKIEKRYSKLRDVITMEKPKVQIPKDKLIRQMIEDPVPVLFASTTYVPKEHSTQKEFLITEPIRLGKGGCDLLFTDTEESRQKLGKLLPESLSQEVTIHLFDDAFKNLPFPIYHNPKKVRWS